MTNRWSTIEHVTKTGGGSGLWLVDPDGNKIVRFPAAHDAIARQCAAALNLTTPTQRVNFLADAAGYK